MKTPRVSALILDLGDVLLNWATTTKTSISGKIIKAIVSSHIWMDFERGRISENACYERAAKHFGVPLDSLTEAFMHSRDTLQSNEAFVTFLKDIKKALHGSLKIYAMSNMSKEDYNFLSGTILGWSIFDDVFTSGNTGLLKPDLGFYRYVLEATNTPPQAAVFIDDKVENTFSADSLGIHGIVFDNNTNVIRKILNLVGDPVHRGKIFLARNAEQMRSVTESGVTIDDNFAQLLILSATKDQSLVRINRQPRTWNFLIEKPLLTTIEYPDDLDTTSIALMELRTDPDVAHSVMDEMLEYLTEDGILQTYFDHTRPRIDPVVCTNALSLFCKHGRGHQLPHTLEWIQSTLLHRAYVNGTRHYTSADCFLFFIHRLLQSSPHNHNLQSTLASLLDERIREQIGLPADALNLAMRLQVCHALEVANDRDMHTLLELQEVDGGWTIGYMHRYGSAGLKLGNRGLTTALAIQTVELFRE